MVSIILPTKNEEPCIAATITKIRKLCGSLRIIVVDGNSRDSTVQIARLHDIEVIYDNGLGKGDALRCAFDHVNDDVIFLDVDGTYPILSLPEFIKALETYDLVVGERVGFAGEALPPLYRVGDAVSRVLFQVLYMTRIDNLSGLRGIRKEALEKLSLESDDFGIETEITAKAVRMGLKIKKIPIIYSVRFGHSKFRPIQDGIIVLRAMFRYRIKKLS